MALAFTLIYGTVGFYLLDRHFSIQFQPVAGGWPDAAHVHRVFEIPSRLPRPALARYFTNSVYLIGAATGGFALLALLAPVLLRRQPDRSEWDRAAEIIRQHGRTVLARFCLFEDKHFFFSTGGSVIAYAYSNRTAVVLGDPIGPHEDAPAAVKAFQEFCFRNDWQAAFYQTLPDTLDAYSSAGLKALKIGEEALVDLQSFSLKGSEMKPI